MKKIIKKGLGTLVITISMIFCVTSIAFAGMPQLRWSHLTMLAGNIEIESDNLCQVTVAADCSPTEADNIKVACELQQLDSSWKSIKTWSETNNNGTTILMQKYYGIAKNYSYRLKVTAKAYKGSKLLETVTSYFDYGYYK